MARLLMLLILLPFQEDWSRRQKVIIKDLREGTVQAKVAAVREAGQYDHIESVAVLVKAWQESEKREIEWQWCPEFENGELQLRKRIAMVIGSYTDPGAVKHLAYQLRISTSESLRETIAAAAWRYPAAAIGDGLRTCLKQDKSALVLKSALESAAILGGKEMAAEVSGCIGHSHRKVRRAAVRASVRLDLADAVSKIIDQIEVDGLLAEDLNQALVGLTGTNKHRNPEEWRRWWKENEAGYPGNRPARAARDEAVERSLKERARGTVATYYGIPVLSRRAIFLLDASSSMSEGGKYGKAVAELKSAIGRLPSGAMFNLITFNGDAFPFSTTMVEATEERRRTAGDWMDGILPEGGTNAYSALMKGINIASGVAAGKVAADTIYLVSDGRPTGSAPAYILGKVAEKNPDAKFVIHTICIGQDADHEFMRALASANDGTHHDR